MKQPGGETTGVQANGEPALMQGETSKVSCSTFRVLTLYFMRIGPLLGTLGGTMRAGKRRKTDNINESIPPYGDTVQVCWKYFTRRTDHDLDNLDPNLPLFMICCAGSV